MPFECCPLWKGASKTRLLCLKTVKGWFSSRNQQVCTHRAHISTAQPGWTHQNTFWNATCCSGISIRDSYPRRKLSIPSQQELYPHQILIFKNLGIFGHLVPQVVLKQKVAEVSMGKTEDPCAWFLIRAKVSSIMWNLTVASLCITGIRHLWTKLMG